MALAFKKAVKHEAKARVALIGPAGSGKTYTGLELARTLVGPEGKIAAVDTEHGSMSKYADLFDFDVMELDSFSPDSFLAALDAAQAAGYGAFVCDSLSHFWMGRDGALEFVDQRSKRASGSDDSFSGWKAFRPHERQMVDAILASKMHVICTMRTKTEYSEVEYTDSQGRKKKKRVKIGLAPVQREGLEYEFDLVGYMDDENALIVDKTRCPAYSLKAIGKPSAKDFAPFVEWLKGAPKQAPVPQTAPSGDPEYDAIVASMVDRPACEAAIEGFREPLGEAEYYAILRQHGVELPADVKTPKAAKAIVRALLMARRAMEGKAA